MIGESLPLSQPKTTPFAAAIAVGIALFAFSISLYILPSALLRITAEIPMNIRQIAELYAVLLWPQLLTVGVGAYLSQFVAKGKILTCACCGLFGGCALIALSRSYGSLMAGCFVLGLAAGLIESSANALLTELYDGPKRTAAMNYAHGAFAVGAIGIPLAMAAMIENDVSWRISFWLAGMGGLVSTCWLAISGTWRLGLPSRFQGSMRASIDTFTLLLCAAMFFYVAAELGVCYWLPIHFRDVLKSGDAVAAASNSVFWAGAFVGRAGVGILGSRFQDRQLLVWSTWAGVISMLIFAQLRSSMAAVMLVALMGLSFACIWPTIVAYAGHVYGLEVGVRLPAIIGVGVIGSAVGPWLSGELASLPAIGQRLAFLINPIFFALILVTLAIAPSAVRVVRQANG